MNLDPRKEPQKRRAEEAAKVGARTLFQRGMRSREKKTPQKTQMHIKTVEI